jgi:hypothetical protein
MNARDLSTLERTDAWLIDLIRVCRKFGPIRIRSPKLAARVTSRARHLQEALRILMQSLEPPPPKAA